MTLTRGYLNTLRAAAIAGILFSVLLATALVLIWISVPADPQERGVWLPHSWRLVTLALNLLPFAGIAFLWFMGVLRDRIGAYGDHLFATVFLGSGLLFLAMLFASAAMAGGTMMVYRVEPRKLMQSGIYTFGRAVTYQIMHIYALKMAAVFMMITCTLSIRTGIFPRWMALLGYAMAMALLLRFGYTHWVPLIFPLWVLFVSLHLLLANLKPLPERV